MVALVCNHEAPLGIDRHPGGAAEARRPGVCGGVRIRSDPVDKARGTTRDGGDVVVGSHPADAVVVTVGYEEVPGRVDRHPDRRGKPCRQAVAVGGAGGAGPGKGAHHPVRIDLADPVVEGVGDKDIAGGVQRDPVGVVEETGSADSIDHAG